MWTCPNCGREFKRAQQNHYCGKAPETVEASIAAQPEDIQPILRQLRDTLRQSLPEAEERIAWSMPSYWAGRHVLQFSAGKSQISLYVGEDAIAAFSPALSEAETRKGTLYLPYGQALPLGLVGEIARWCYEAMKHDGDQTKN